MSNKIFVNLPITNLQKSIAFYTAMDSPRTFSSVTTPLPAW